MFRFRQFTVYDDRCAMKVGTDAVLLGAWIDCHKGGRLIDIGTGSGIIALAMAQRCVDASLNAAIDAVEIDADAAVQASDNFKASPWSAMLQVHNESIQQFVESAEAGSYDLVFSNPPYFVSSLKCDDAARNTARHDCSLSYDELIDASAYLLSDEGFLSVVLPADTAPEFIMNACCKGFYPVRQTFFKTTSSKKASRVLVELSKTLQNEIATTELTLGGDAYAKLTEVFYF